MSSGSDSTSSNLFSGSSIISEAPNNLNNSTDNVKSNFNNKNDNDNNNNNNKNVNGTTDNEGGSNIAVLVLQNDNAWNVHEHI